MAVVYIVLKETLCSVSVTYIDMLCVCFCDMWKQIVSHVSGTY